jgi:microcystin-dependent protein
MPSIPFVGQIMPAAFGFTPTNWAPCNGQLLPIQQNQALFSLLGTSFGGDGVRTFALPDLRGRAVLGSDFRTVAWGQIDGTEQVTMTTDNLPSHTHPLQASTTTGATGRAVPPAGKLFGVNPGTAPAAIFAPAGSSEVPLAVGTNVPPVGGSQPHNNMQPYLVINYLIALTGQFPPRP